MDCTVSGCQTAPTTIEYQVHWWDRNKIEFLRLCPEHTGVFMAHRRSIRADVVKLHDPKQA